MSHPDLPKLFVDACAASEELEHLTYDFEFVNGQWWDGQLLLSDDLASLAILGACVKALTNHTEEDWGIESRSHPDPTCAACLAVVAVFKKEGDDMKYETIPQSVTAWQAPADMELIDDSKAYTKTDGPPKVPVKKGQWVVENWNGERYSVMDEARFRKTFREVNVKLELEIVPANLKRQPREYPPPYDRPHIWFGPTFIPSEPVKPGTPMCGDQP